MRVRITLKVNNRGGLVPFHHQFLVAQLLKGLIIQD
ncbi:MAG: CRISPR-associated endoribonuclease Cas6, partial [Cyclobacteriaceae bacterium]